MISARSTAIARALAHLTLLMTVLGGCSMGGKRSDATTLLWRSQMGRTPAHKIAARVDSYAPLSRGFFGLGRSLSYGGPAGLPNPMELEATVLQSDPGFTAPAIKLVLSAGEVSKLEPKERVVLALVPGNICIGVAPIPADIQAGPTLDAWLAAWTLPKEPEIE